MVGDAVEAYLSLVLLPLAKELKASGRSVSAICGNLPADTCRHLEGLLPETRAIGRQSPYDFERMLKNADLLITSPGSTTILQAMSMKLPTLLLPPQNLSQFLNTQIFSAPGAPTMSWPASLMAPEKIEKLRPDGEDAVLTYIYQSICDATASAEAAEAIAESIRAGLLATPEEGVLDRSLAALGSNGARQIAQLIRQAMLAPIPRRVQRAATTTRQGVPPGRGDAN